jgi:hypothetical protein
LPGYLLDKLLKKNGRIPVISFYGNTFYVSAFKEIAKKTFARVGFASCKIAEKLLGQTFQSNLSKQTLYDNGMQLIVDPDIDCLILEIDVNDPLIDLPVDNIDLLILGKPEKSDLLLKEESVSTLENISNKCLVLDGDIKIEDASKRIVLEKDIKMQFQNLVQSLKY